MVGSSDKDSATVTHAIAICFPFLFEILPTSCKDGKHQTIEEIGIFNLLRRIDKKSTKVNGTCIDGKCILTNFENKTVAILMLHTWKKCLDNRSAWLKMNRKCNYAIYFKKY